MLLRTAVLLALFSCPPGPAPHPPCGFVGDATRAVALLPIAAGADGLLRALHDGDEVQLQKPPQGGFVIYAGVAATNLNRCLQSTAELIDVASGQPLTGIDQRNADLVDEHVGYFWPPDIFQTPNIPACPDALHVGVVNRSAILRVDVTDTDGRTGRAEVHVTPVCSDASCTCICGPNPTHC
ncbi:MAG: hypothetical protein ABR567_03810 [Myxococcales bacterium]|nr:hypothetical protein [Myxococcales bacterium]